MAKPRHTPHQDSILIFTPNNPFPPRHGSHHRVIQQISDISDSFNIYIASSKKSTDSPWHKDKQECAKVKQDYHISQIYLFEDSFWFTLYRAVNFLLMKAFLLSRYPPTHVLIAYIYRYCMIAWFTVLSLLIKPRLIIIHYTRWAHLCNLLSNANRAIELHDMLPVNQYLAAKIIDLIKAPDFRAAHCSIPWPLYIVNQSQLPHHVINEILNEIRVLNKFNLVWAIADREMRLLQEMGLKAKTLLINPNINTVPSAKVKDLPPLLPIGPNPFNDYSLLAFIHDVLPRVDPEAFMDESILVTGSLLCNLHVEFKPPLTYIGFVTDYPDRLARSRLMIAPTGVGTGQQVKIFEALAMATPVICYKQAISISMLTDHPCIIAVETPDEFAAQLTRFLTDKSLQHIYHQMAADSAKKLLDVSASNPYLTSIDDFISSEGS